MVQRHQAGVRIFTKVRYRGLNMNAQRLFVARALVNLFMARRRIVAHGLWIIPVANPPMTSTNSVNDTDKSVRHDRFDDNDQQNLLSLNYSDVP